jgi:hypothetical protein
MFGPSTTVYFDFPLRFETEREANTAVRKIVRRQGLRFQAKTSRVTYIKDGKVKETYRTRLAVGLE